MNTALQSIQVAQHPASVDAYIRHGFSLVPVPSGTKGPRQVGWNLEANTLKNQADLPHGYGIGLAHAYSKTCALDIDDWPCAATMLKEAGIDLQALYDANDAVIVDSGRAGHGKLLYSLETPLQTKKITKDGVTVYELRCSTSNGLTVQDILPPSIHPLTNQPYRWSGKGHWSRLPMIPDALLTLWQSMIEPAPTVVATVNAMPVDWSEIVSAVNTIDPSCDRDTWTQIGMALKTIGDQGYQLWHDWSESSESKFPGEREIQAQWSSFRNDKSQSIKIGTLFRIAKTHGWIKPLPDVTAMFGAIGTPTTPDAVLMDMRPRPPVMNIDLWPGVLAQRAKEIGETVGCDPLVPLFAGLATACGAVDARSRLELLPNFRVPPILWLMTIGAPADKKTPGSTPMFAPLRAIEEEARPQFAKDFLEWEGKEAAYAASKKAFLEFRASPEALLGGMGPSVSDLAPAPAPLRITVDDVTSQKLVRMCADRPRGLLCSLDEMNSWIRKMTDKQSGEDRSCWTKSYESAPYEMDRVGAGSIRADNMAVSIYGNIQPRVFRESLHNMSADGLIQRFVPCILATEATRKPNPIPEFLQSAGVWEQAVRVIYAMPEMLYTLTPAAFKVYDAFQDWYGVQRKDEQLLQSDDTFMTAFGKLEGLAGRLALMFHMLETPFVLQVSADTMTRATDVIRDYVVPALRYALDSVGGESFDSWLVNHIIHNSDKLTLTMVEIKQSARKQFLDVQTWRQDQMVLGAMHPLERDRWVIRMDDGSQEHRHVAEWAINPNLIQMFKDFRRKVINAKQRMTDKIYAASLQPRHTVRGYDPSLDEPNERWK